MDEQREPTQSSQPGQPGQNEEQRARLAESWREVGEQLQELFNKLASAFRVAWSEERQPEQDEQMRGVQYELRTTAERIERVVKRLAAETEAERSSAMQTTREASERSFSEARTVAVRTLRNLNDQLDQLSKCLEQQPGNQSSQTMTEQSSPSQSTEPPSSGSDTSDQPPTTVV